MKIVLSILIAILTVLLIYPFLIIGLLTENKQTIEVAVIPPEYIPQHIDEKPVTILDENYSPGKKDWHTPNKQEEEENTKQTKWEHYLVAMHEWGKKELDKWVCKKCGKKLNENFHFLDRSGKNIRFQCKCSCGHEPIITLDDNK